jgi:hypothetical protein
MALLCTVLLLSSISCNNSSRSSDEIEDYYSEDDGYDDGSYCADVTYNNPNTGTTNTYPPSGASIFQACAAP